MTKTLAERITSARKIATVRITDLEKLIAEVGAEQDQISAASESATADSVDLALSDEDRDGAAGLAERYARTARALGTAKTDLIAILARKLETDAQKAKQAAQSAALKRRDELVDRITKEWPEICAKSVALFEEMRDCEEQMKAAGVSAPCAEAIARGCEGHLSWQHNRISQIRLPALALGQSAWPAPIPNGLAE